MNEVKNDKIRQEVSKAYGKVANANTDDCGCTPISCCSPKTLPSAQVVSVGLGYSQQDVSSVPEGANMGLGCGNPQAIASLQPGETVLDLGSGGGFDCFLAAKQVGDSGHVIGVDMTSDMITKSRKNAQEGGYTHVEFRLGEIEHLPVADNTVDVIISNCVINLSPDKSSVFREMFRVLKPSGRLAISDVVTTAPLPDDILNDMNLYSCCVSGASSIAENESLLKDAGFSEIRITPKEELKEAVHEWVPDRNIEDYIVSANIEGIKEKRASC